MIVRCLIKGSFRLDVSAVARRLRHSIQIGALNPKLRASFFIVAVGVPVAFQTLNLCLMAFNDHGVSDD